MKKLNEMLTVRTGQDSLGDWHAVIDDNDGNTIAGLPGGDTYGYETEAEAQVQAQKLIDRKTRQGIDIDGGGYVGE